MRILILGGTGRTGSVIIDEALTRGHTVTALVRDPGVVPSKDGLTIVKGTPLEKTDVNRAFEATPDDKPASVIVALSSKRETNSPFSKAVSPPRMMADANALVVKAMKEYGVRKLVVMQALGVGDSFKNLPFPMRMIVRNSQMARSYEDHDLLDKEVRSCGLDYVLARPSRLVEGDVMPIKFFGDKGNGIGSMSTITRKTIAAFLVDAAEKSDWNGTTPVVAN
ncbi:hypothetical protein MMC17_008813 [Xylographa soralifera]|nr:hypothetical protein [Xylographa soralifera]